MEKLNLTNNNSGNITVKFTLDKYTKIVLSVIALCLIFIVSSIYLKPSNLEAQQTVQDVNLKYINGSSLWGSELPVNLEEINGRSISNDNIPVDIQSLRGSSLWDDKIPVDVKAVNGIPVSGSEVPVKVK